MAKNTGKGSRKGSVENRKAVREANMSVDTQFSYFCPGCPPENSRRKCTWCSGMGFKWGELDWNSGDNKKNMCLRCHGSGNAQPCNFCGKWKMTYFNESHIASTGSPFREWLIGAVAKHYRDHAGGELYYDRQSADLCTRCGSPPKVTRFLWMRMRDRSVNGDHRSCKPDYRHADQVALTKLESNGWPEEVLAIAQKALADAPYRSAYWK